MTNEDLLLGSIDIPEALKSMSEEELEAALPQAHFLATGADVATTRRLVHELKIGPVAPCQEVETTCGEPRCVSPWHMRLGAPKNGQDPNGVQVPAEADCYFRAIERISSARGYPRDVHRFAGFAVALMFMQRALINGAAFRDKSAGAYLLGLLESFASWTGVEVHEAQMLGGAIRIAEGLPGPLVIGAPPQPRPLRLVNLPPDVAALMPRS